MVFICAPYPLMVTEPLGPLSRMPWFESVIVYSRFGLNALVMEPAGPVAPVAPCALAAPAALEDLAVPAAR